MKSYKAQLSELMADQLCPIKIRKIEGRYVYDENRKFIDYVTTNYLGFDFDQHLQQKGEQAAREWGSLTGWSRLEADPEIYVNLEKKIGRFLNSGEVILSHTVTITNFSLIPPIAEKGLIICDKKVHSVVWEACRLARDHGAQLLQFKHQDINDLESILKKNKDTQPKLVAVDGVYSISTELAPIKDLQFLCEKYNAWLYVDDAHGFGVLGRPL